jgi:MFS-type transporter involved in bile tolerance (Atg22 family)
MPFIIVTLPLAALFFALVPYASEISLWALILVVFALNVFKQSARGPVVALMPDTIPGKYRSEANGVINTMGGIAAIVGTIGLARLMDLDMRLPMIGATKERLPFPLAGILVVLATVLLFLFVHEKNQPLDQAVAQEKRIGLKESLSTLFSKKDKSALRILISLFLWFLAYQGVLPFIGKFGVESLGASSGLAALAAGMVGIAYALFAVPSGFLAHRLGRKRTIRWALAALVVVLGFLFFFLPVTNALGLAGMTRLALFWAAMFVFGMFWVTIITNSFPMLWQMADYGTVGIYTGLYYTFSQAAAITAPPLTGLLIDLAGYPAIFLFGALCMAGAWAVMGSVRSGEAEDTSKQS